MRETREKGKHSVTYPFRIGGEVAISAREKLQGTGPPFVVEEGFS